MTQLLRPLDINNPGCKLMVASDENILHNPEMSSIGSQRSNWYIYCVFCLSEKPTIDMFTLGSC